MIRELNGLEKNILIYAATTGAVRIKEVTARFKVDQGRVAKAVAHLMIHGYLDSDAMNDCARISED